MAEKDDNFEVGLKHYYDLIQTEQSLGKEYTRLLWTYAGAALALSITIMSSPLGKNMNQCKAMLIVSWILLIISIILNLISIKCSQKAFQNEINQVREELDKKGELSSESLTDIFKSLTNGLETIAGVCLIIGISLLAAFIGINFY